MATIIWNGGTDSFWATDTNWDLGRVPANGDELDIGTGTVIDMDGTDIPAGVIVNMTGGELRTSDSSTWTNVGEINLNGGGLTFCYNSGVINNFVTLSFNNDTDLGIGNGGTINNFATLNFIYGASNGGAISSTGVGTSVSFLYGSFNFGSVELSNISSCIIDNTSMIGDSALDISGTITVGSGCYLTLNGHFSSGAIYLLSGSTSVMSGSFHSDSGTAFTIYSGALVSFNAGYAQNITLDTNAICNFNQSSSLGEIATIGTGAVCYFNDNAIMRGSIVGNGTVRFTNKKAFLYSLNGSTRGTASNTKFPSNFGAQTL